jgi:hypothetical protein
MTWPGGHGNRPTPGLGGQGSQMLADDGELYAKEAGIWN